MYYNPQLRRRKLQEEQRLRDEEKRRQEDLEQEAKRERRKQERLLQQQKRQAEERERELQREAQLAAARAAVGAAAGAGAARTDSRENGPNSYLPPSRMIQVDRSKPSPASSLSVALSQSPQIVKQQQQQQPSSKSSSRSRVAVQRSLLGRSSSSSDENDIHRKTLKSNSSLVKFKSTTTTTTNKQQQSSHAATNGNGAAMNRAAAKRPLADDSSSSSSSDDQKNRSSRVNAKSTTATRGRQQHQQPCHAAMNGAAACATGGLKKNNTYSDSSDDDGKVPAQKPAAAAPVGIPKKPPLFAFLLNRSDSSSSDEAEEDKNKQKAEEEKSSSAGDDRHNPNMKEQQGLSNERRRDSQDDNIGKKGLQLSSSSFHGSLKPPPDASSNKEKPHESRPTPPATTTTTVTFTTSTKRSSSTESPLAALDDDNVNADDYGSNDMAPTMKDVLSQKKMTSPSSIAALKPPPPPPQQQESSSQRVVGQKHDILWSDDDEDHDADDEKEKQKKTKASSSRAKKIDAADKTKSDKDTKSKSSNRAAPRAIPVEAEKADDGGYDYDTDYSAKDSPDSLYPKFENPHFGPYREEPLVLEQGGQDCTTCEVPMSINRYLPDFQQEGICFLYERLSAGNGAILGDDMGLGKTVQIVSLLAALLQKKGNGQDRTELKRRKRNARKLREEINAANQMAFREGKLPDEDDRAFLEVSGIPAWSPVLIVVPKAVVDQWMIAFKTWGHFAVEELPSGAERKKATMDRIRYGESEILVCKHSIFTDASHLGLLKAIPWKLVIMDEFHMFKNKDAKRTINFRAFREMVKRFLVVGLTGTLMQNNHEELWNLIDLVAPGFLGEWTDFNRDYADPIKQGEKKGAAPITKDEGDAKSEEFKRLKLPQVYIQRLKVVVLSDQLPAKDEMIVFCELSQTQKDIYKYILEQPDFVLLSQANGPCDCKKNDKFFREYNLLSTREQKIDYLRRNKHDFKKRSVCHYRCPWDETSPDGISEKAVLWRQLERHRTDFPCLFCPWCLCFPALGILNKLVNHASLLQASENPDFLEMGTMKHRKAVKELEQAQVFLPPEIVAKCFTEDDKPWGYFRANSVTDNHSELSGKMKVLDKLLRKIKNDPRSRVLVFSAYTKTLDIIENFVRMHYAYKRMDGSTPASQREKIVKEFKNDQNIFVFLLSTKAMGLGLNLTEANTVIIYDVEFNPSWDNQAQDRAYRIGQDQDVKVYRLVSRGTMEELKYLRQVYKTQLKDKTMGDQDEAENDPTKKRFRGVAGDRENKGELFGMANLLKFRDGPFMKYRSSASVQRKNGDDGDGDDVDQIGVDDILATIKDMPEEEIDNIGVDTVAEMEALASHRGEKETSRKKCNKRQARVTSNDDDADSDDTAFYEDHGAESQVIKDICERIEVDASVLETAPASLSTCVPLSVQSGVPGASAGACGLTGVPSPVASAVMDKSGKHAADAAESPLQAKEPPKAAKKCKQKNKKQKGMTEEGTKTAAAVTAADLFDLKRPEKASKKQKSG